MSEKRVTYLIGAGASANALPVVNGMNDRMKLFYNLLFDINKDRKIVQESEFVKLYDLLEKITTHQTIDTYAKKLWYKNDTSNYSLLKRFLICYLIFEQIEKSNQNGILDNVIFNVENEGTSIFKQQERFYIEGENELRKKLDKIKDERYDSVFASLLNSNRLLDSNINIVSWNYDLQLELSYSDFYQAKKEIDEIQDILQVFPRSETLNDVDMDKSSIIKINGTGCFRDLSDKSVNFFDVINESFSEKRFVEYLLKVLFKYKDGKNVNNQLKFAWESDEQVTKARQYAQKVIGESDVVVVIGYSFPTFNREIDREIFKIFNENCVYFSPFNAYTSNKKAVDKKILKKIYIQDTPQNAPKIKERLKAIGSNLFDVAEIYDDIDQFLIPYEL